MKKTSRFQSSHISTVALYMLLFVLISSCKKEDNLPPVIQSIDFQINRFDPFEVSFTATVTDQEFDPITYSWDFGDGETDETGSDVSHIFETGKTYQVILSVKDEFNSPQSETIQVDARLVEAVLKLDPATTYQTMQGFGGFGAQRTWWNSEPFYDQNFVKTLIEDLGVTILRDNIPIGFEPQNENADPNDLDLSKFNITDDTQGADSHLGQHFPYLKAMHDAGLEKLIATVWSPPIWMKHNDHQGNGTSDQTSAPPYEVNPGPNTNQLKVENYEEFAEYCVAYIRILKQETGIDLYAISLQNEPRFSQFYASCVHSPESLRDLIKVVGARFEQEGIQTKIFIPEDVQSMFHIRQYLDAVLNDPLANAYTDIFAIHNYRDNGVDPSDEGPSNWQETYQKAQQGNKEVWMTETSGFNSETIDGGITLATSMFNAIHYGNSVAWVYWQMSDGGDSPLIKDGTDKTYLYYVSKHFYRYIRPGAVRFKVEESDPDLLALGFEHPVSGQKTVIAINIGDVARQVEFDNAYENDIFALYQTNRGNFHEKIGTNIEGSSAVIIPPKGILTWVSE